MCAGSITVVVIVDKKNVTVAVGFLDTAYSNPPKFNVVKMVKNHLLDPLELPSAVPAK